ncbi:MAG: hypothetical protein ACO38U_07520 [Burkholderiaceae bacterium]
MVIEMKNEANGNKGYASLKMGDITFSIHERWDGRFRVYARGGYKRVWELPNMEDVKALVKKFERE